MTEEKKLAPLTIKLNDALKDAIKTKDTTRKNIIRVVLAEISREEAGFKTFTDGEVEILIRKIQKNLSEVKTEEAEKENKILEEYVSKLMSEEEIEKEVKSIISENSITDMKGMGIVMKKFNEKFKGKADNGIVSSIVKKSLI